MCLNYDSLQNGARRTSRGALGLEITGFIFLVSGNLVLVDPCWESCRSL